LISGMSSLTCIGFCFFFSLRIPSPRVFGDVLRAGGHYGEIS
jgi:hypothetical protein